MYENLEWLSDVISTANDGILRKIKDERKVSTNIQVSLEMLYEKQYKKLDKKNKWNKKLFNGLKEEDQEEFINRPLRVITLLKDSHPKVKYEMFERLNRGSVSLNDQEIRNCVYRGD
ncbi:hypothetical protein LCGC14_1362510, partial [marine sediment metagenome]